MLFIVSIYILHALNILKALYNFYAIYYVLHLKQYKSSTGRQHNKAYKIKTFHGYVVQCGVLLPALYADAC